LIEETSASKISFDADRLQAHLLRRHDARNQHAPFLHLKGEQAVHLLAVLKPAVVDLDPDGLVADTLGKAAFLRRHDADARSAANGRPLDRTPRQERQGSQRRPGPFH
jgi:hypothetical protein